jgi:hypothetical protein
MQINHPLSSAEAWSGTVYFTPFVGRDYDQGLVDGTKVLVLGESHYGTKSELPGSGRDCTIYNFQEYASESCDIDNQSQFFRKLPRIVTRNSATTQAESAAAWTRISYSNFVQDFAGAHAWQRPSHEQWLAGQAALTEIAERLKPDVILVLGAQLWNDITVGSKCDEPPIKAQRRDREIWLVPHSDGYARTSWVYHPSRNYESLQSSIDVFSSLLNRAAAGPAMPSGPATNPAFKAPLEEALDS